MKVIRASARGEGALALLRSLDARASARGGSLVAWGARRASFAFDPGDIEAAVRALAEGEDASAFGAGLAEGAVAPLAAEGARAGLAWGEALCVAEALCDLARGGELVAAENVVTAGGLAGTRRVRARAWGKIVRGRLVPLARPLREEMARDLSRLRVPRLVRVDVEAIPVSAGALTLVRADRGFGGSRVLDALAARAPRSLQLGPSGHGLAPMGSVRRAVERSITHDLGPRLVALAEPLDALLSGEALDAETVASLVRAYFGARAARPDLPAASSVPLVLVDDADLVDASSLEACARAAQGGAGVAVVVRLPPGHAVPAALASLPRAGEVELGALEPAEARALAIDCVGGGAGSEATAPWAARSGGTPLGVVEALTTALATSELGWTDDGGLRASRRVRGRGAARPAAAWIRARAEALPSGPRALLAIVALLGGEARVARVARVVEEADLELDLEATIASLVRERWLVDVQEDWIGLPSRTHVEVIATLPSVEERRALHGAMAAILRSDEGSFGRAEAAHHAAAEGDGARAARSALDVGRVAASVGLQAGATSLVAFAKAVDPSCEDAAREVLALARATVVGVSARAPKAPTASEKLLAAVPVAEPAAPPASMRPPTPALPFTPVALPASIAPPAGPVASEVAARIGELAREAILSADSTKLDRWLDGREQEKPILSERMRALARVGRGEIGDALRVLRRMREALPADEHALRCQTSLALGVTLSMGGRPAEALLEGLDALARARAAGDARGAQACLAFLAKLYASVGRPEDAARIRAVG